MKISHSISDCEKWSIKMEKNNEKQRRTVLLPKLVLLLAAIYFCFAMPFLTGAGLVYNRESYGTELSCIGIFFIISAFMMLAGTVFCISGKKIRHILSVIFTSTGCIFCMILLKKLTDHADRSGWADKLDMTPISAMYERRLLPCIIPVLLIIIADAVYLMKHKR